MVNPNKEEITTIKLSKETKDRLDKLRIYKRESYDEVLQSMLETLNTCRMDPEKAKAKLLFMEKQRKSNDFQ